MSTKFFLSLERKVNLFEPEKDKLKNILLEELSFLPINNNDLLLITTAFDISFDGHKNAPKRASGEAYFFHPLRVTLRIIWRQRYLKILDVKTITEALIHDCFEDALLGGINPVLMRTNIQILLSEEIAYDTLCVTKQEKKGDKNETESSDEYFERILRCESWRPFWVKFDDRIDNIWTISHKSKQSAINKIKETEKWFPFLMERMKTLIEREIDKKRLSTQLSVLPNLLYKELRDITRIQKNNLT